jgi:hypothetical protein
LGCVLTEQDREELLKDPAAFLNARSGAWPGFSVGEGQRQLEQVVAGITVIDYLARPVRRSLVLTPLSIHLSDADPDGQFVVCELPYVYTAATRITLSSSFDMFVTHQLSGCWMIVGGPPQSPVVVHASAEIPRAVLEAVAVRLVGPDYVLFNSGDEGINWFFGFRDRNGVAWRFYGQGTDDCIQWTTRLMWS